MRSTIAAATQATSASASERRVTGGKLPSLADSMGNDFDTLIVGAGYAGAIMAERLVNGSGQRVLVIDRRDHIAVNAYDYHDEHGILVHKYGPHIFHTNHMPVVDYLSQFTEWRPYEHRVVTRVRDDLLVPIDRKS